ncbi:MAG TPA: AI-2E family transporter [Syntrophomonadaceae bacterium]|nr:AI-2E family transporter [Syntrophomonadaceae bacterium]
MNHKSDNADRQNPVKLIIWAGIILLIIMNFSGVVNIIANIFGVFYPLLLGAAIAYVLNILAAGYEKIYFPASNNRFINNTRRATVVILAILTVVLILVLLLRVIIPQFVESIRLLIAGFPAMYDSVMVWLNKNADLLPGLKQYIATMDMDGEALIKKGFELIGNWAFGTVSLIGTFFSKMANYLLAIIFGIYLLFGKDQIKRNFARLFDTYLRPERREKLYHGLRVADEAFSSYIIGQFKEAVILGLLCTIGMLIFGFPYAATIGPVIGFTALIPLIGAYIGAGLGFLLIVMVAPLKALGFIVFIIILQQIEGNLIYPKVVGDTIGLPGIWVFAAIIVGGGLLGIAGILLSVPVAATIYKLLAKDINQKQKYRDGSLVSSSPAD